LTRRRRAGPAARGVSIVVASWNTRDVTLACVERARQHTPVPAEVIVVDNGSTDGSAEAVEVLAAVAGPVPVRLLRNASNEGYARAVNQGLAVATGRWIVLLNSDVLVTPGWLRRLLGAARDPRVGLVGPMTNCAGSADQALAAPPRYDSPASLDDFAERWAAAHPGERRRVERLVGFCLLVRRAVVERLGRLDERFGLGNFEDDDLCRRVRQAGYTLVVARDVFVHHFGSLSFRVNGVDHGALMRENAGRFAAKWAPAVRRPHAARRATVSLCMIARDEAEQIGRCLESAAAVVDEMVVVDTGSRDDTAGVARAHGATVLHVPWADDFSAARNAALDAAGGEWVLSLDADEALAPRAAARLRDTLGATRAPGLRVPIHDVSPDGGTTSVHLLVRVFRRAPAHRFAGRVHEQVTVPHGETADLPILHYGYADPATLRAKQIRNRALLERAVGEAPADAAVRYYLACACLGLGDVEAAAGAAEAALAVAGPQQVELRLQALQTLAEARLAAGDYAAAERACEAALAAEPDWIDARLLLGRLHRRAGRCRQALVELGRFLGDRARLAADPAWPVRFPLLGSIGAEAPARAELALVHAALGGLERARREAERARRLAPRRADIAQVLAGIEARLDAARSPWRDTP
jgi:GT2 family glycosyltransferase/tetratricopeptide (TPR) repeat protein